MNKKSLALWLVIGVLGLGAIGSIVRASTGGSTGGTTINIQNCNSCSFATAAEQVQKAVTGVVQGLQAMLGGTGSRFPDGLSADTTSPVKGQLRGTTLTITGTTTMNGINIQNVPVVNQTSSIAEYDNDPQNIPSITAANTEAIYSDDLSRMLQVGTSTAGSMYLRNSSFAAASQLYYGIAAQTITASTLNGANGFFAGAVTYQGYHYALVMNTTTGNYSFVRATSSPQVDLSQSASWSTSTISGLAVTSSARLIGAANNNLYITGSTTSSTIPYAISTSGTSTLTSQPPIFIANVTGQPNLDYNSRVNDNGIYVSSSTAPFISKYTLTGAFVGGSLNPLVAAPGNGPDLFVTRFSFYGLAGGSTSVLTRLVGF